MKVDRMTIVDYDNNRILVTYTSTERITQGEYDIAECIIWVIVGNEKLGVSYTFAGHINIVNHENYLEPTEHEEYEYLNQLKELVTPEMKAA